MGSPVPGWASNEDALDRREPTHGKMGPGISVSRHPRGTCRDRHLSCTVSG
jgi:hypothetical protein